MAFRISSRRRLKAEKGKRIDGLIRPFLSLARRSAVYPSLRAIRLRWGRSRDFLFVRFVFVSIRGDCVVAHRHPRPRIAAAVIYRFATRLEARDNKARRLRGCRGPPRARCRLPRRTCVCVCVCTRGMVVWCWKAKIPRSVFHRAECCRVTWNIGFGEKGLFLDPGIVSPLERVKDSLQFWIFNCCSDEVKGIRSTRADCLVFHVSNINRENTFGKGMLVSRNSLSGNHDTSNRQRR